MRTTEAPDIVDQCLRSFVRASAVAAFVVGIVAFVAYPGSSYNHGTVVEIVAEDATFFTAVAAMLSLMVSLISFIANPNGRISRPMVFYNCLNTATIVLIFLR